MKTTGGILTRPMQQRKRRVPGDIRNFIMISSLVNTGSPKPYTIILLFNIDLSKTDSIFNIQQPSGS
jgi:hypothetical protein